jgi:cyanophycinase-like exopeptidase
LIAPLYLLADSRLLFLPVGNSFTAEIRSSIPNPNPKAAYIGASNGDRAEFYELFVAAMQSMEISHCLMVPSQPSHEDREFLEQADLILLAGGEVEHGWRVFERNGVRDIIEKKRYDGAVLVGISAGAVQLGLGALTEAAQPKHLATFGFAPFYVGAHEEKEGWWNLRALVTMSQTSAYGIGIPAGGGAIYRPDGTLEPVREPLTELLKEGDAVRKRLIAPLPAGEVGASSPNG